VSDDAAPRGGGVAFVEHEIDHAQDRVEPFRQFFALRNLVRDVCVANLALGANNPLRQG